MQLERKKRRRKERMAGGVFLLISFSFVAALVLDFDFVSPSTFASVQEDLSYLGEQLDRQHISAWAWLITGILTVLAMPVYLSVARKHQSVMPFLNSFLLLGAGVGFIVMGKLGIDLYQLLLGSAVDSPDNMTEASRLTILEQFSEEQRYRRYGSFGMGLFAFGLGLTGFRVTQFPGVAAVLLLLAGPVLAFFNCYNPDHLGKTAAMAGIMTGVVIFSVRLINRGLGEGHLGRK